MLEKKQILIVDDDEAIGNMLEEALAKTGYEVCRAYSGTEALLVLKTLKPDLILLDLMLPGITGEDVLRNIRGIPVIVISAKIGVDDKVNLLMNGAVDYVTKPFDIKELLARIAVHLRNHYCSAEDNLLKVDDVSLDLNSHEVFVNSTAIKLTKTEFAILRILMAGAGKAISKTLILDELSSEMLDCTDSSLKMHVSNLRKKIRQVNHVDYIEAVWGIGFRFVRV